MNFKLTLEQKGQILESSERMYRGGHNGLYAIPLDNGYYAEVKCSIDDFDYEFKTQFEVRVMYRRVGEDKPRLITELDIELKSTNFTLPFKKFKAGEIALAIINAIEKGCENE